MSGALHGAARAARRLADALHGDVASAQTRLEHVRLTQRAAEAARVATELETELADGSYPDDCDCALPEPETD